MPEEKDSEEGRLSEPAVVSLQSIMDRCCIEILDDPTDEAGRARIGDFIEYLLLEKGIDGIYPSAGSSFLCEAREGAENPLGVLVSRCRDAYDYDQKTKAEYEDKLTALQSALMLLEAGDPEAVRQFVHCAETSYTNTEVRDPSDIGDVIRAQANQDYQRQIREAKSDVEKVLLYTERVFSDMDELSFAMAYEGDEEELFRKIDNAGKRLKIIRRGLRQGIGAERAAENLRMMHRTKKKESRILLAAAVAAFITSLGVGAFQLYRERKEHERMANLPTVEYIVQPGDTFYGLSERFIADKDRYEKQGITRHVMEMNGYDDPSRLRPGDRIMLPTEGMDSARVRELGGR